MSVTGEEVLEWIERQHWVITPWQAELIRKADWSRPFEPFQLRTPPRAPVQTSRAQRRRRTRAERIRARRRSPTGYFIIDEMACWEGSCGR